MRRLSFMLGRAAVRKKGIYRKEFEGLVTRMGGKKKPAIVAVGRKLLRLMYSVARAKRSYTPEPPSRQVHTMREGRAARFFPLFVANGVTSVREMGTFLDSLTHWRSRADAGMLAPRIAAAGHIVNGPPPTGAQRPPAGQPTPAWVYSFAASTPEEARSAVDTLVARRVDFVKPYSGLSRDTYFALAQAARERGIPLAGHVPAAVTPAEAADAGQRTMEHLLGIMESCVPDWDRRLQELVGLLRGPDAASDSGREAARQATRQIFEAYSRELCDPLFARFREKDVYHTPTLVQLRGLSRRQEEAARSDPRLRFVPPSIRERWQPRPRGDSLRLLDTYHAYVKLLGEIHRSGVPILAGTDASDEAYVFPGSSLHEEMETFVRAGMSPLEALRAATRNPARALGLEDSIGSIERGKLADLVLLNGNPLEEIRNTQRFSAVVLNGRYLDRSALDALLAEAERIASAPAN